MPISPSGLVEAILLRIPVQTGMQLDDWVRLIHSEGPDDPDKLLLWLKDDKGLSHAQATLLMNEAGATSDLEVDVASND